MKRVLKNTMMIIGGFCWFTLAIGVGYFLFQNYVTGASEDEYFDYNFGVSSGSVLIGLVHFVGFVAAAVLSFIIGLGLCVHGFVPDSRDPISSTESHNISSSAVEYTGSTEYCVRCRETLCSKDRICPKCGWTQPYEA